MVYKLNFSISELNISGKAIPEKVCDKLLKWHILPMQVVRNLLGVAIWASQSSGYRSKWWEKNHGRNGKSQHCFIGKGAIDWTCKYFDINKDKLVELIIEHTDYTRIAVYDTFIHCDYKNTKSGVRELYSSKSDSKWQFVRYLKAS